MRQLTGSVKDFRHAGVQVMSESLKLALNLLRDNFSISTLITPSGFPVTGRKHEITPFGFVSIFASVGRLSDRAFIRGSAFTFLLSWTGYMLST